MDRDGGVIEGGRGKCVSDSGWFVASSCWYSVLLEVWKRQRYNWTDVEVEIARNGATLLRGLVGLGAVERIRLEPGVLLGGRFIGSWRGNWKLLSFGIVSWGWRVGVSLSSRA